MDIAVLGAGAIGGYCGAKFARAGHHVIFIDRGAHLQAIRDRGLTVRSPLGDFTVQAPAEEDAARVGKVDLVIVGVKTYDNADALPSLTALVGPSTSVLTFQNGVDSIDQVAAVVGPQAVLGGAAYIATAQVEPGVIEQTSTHRRFVFGEVFGDRTRLTARVERIGAAFHAADMQAEVVADARVPLWDKFIYLSPFAGFTAATRLPIGPLRTEPACRERFIGALGELEQVARAEGIAVAPDIGRRIMEYVDAIGPATRSSLLFDLSRAKPLELEALLGSVVRRARRHGLPVPIMTTLYAVLKPYEQGGQPEALPSA